MNTRLLAKRAIKIISFIILAIYLQVGCTEPRERQGDPLVFTKLTDLTVRPIWFEDADGVKFLHASNSEVTGSNDIYATTLADNFTETVWSVAHNHDYTPSFGGQYMAISTPSPVGGVYLQDLTTGEGVLRLPGGRNPSWVSDNPACLMEGPDSRLMAYDFNDADTIHQVLELGQHPFGAPIGPSFAYLTPSIGPHGTTWDLNTSTYPSGVPNASILEDVAPEISWDLSATRFYITQIREDGNADIYRIILNIPEDSQPLILGASQPSLGNNGEHMAVREVVDGEAGSIVLHNLIAGTMQVISATGRNAAVHPTESMLLIEEDDGIYLVDF